MQYLRRNTLALCVIASLGLASANASAQDTAGGVSAAQAGAVAGADQKKSAQLGEITVSANTVDTLAPSAAPLQATQPTSVIDERFIRDGLRFNANFDDIIKYAPSVTTTSPEGPGMGKNEGMSIRGFQDGQFNITFDGIPFGDASDLHHTTSAYFTNHVLGQAEIDRGPGSASTLGNATFGGTIGLRSRNPSDDPGVTAYITGGVWNTWAVGANIDENLSDKTKLFADISKEASDTYLKGTNDKREHIFLKTVTEFSDDTSLTFVTGYNREHQNTVQGVSLDEIATYGWRFGLGNDPSVQNYWGYNNAAYYSSFTYLGLKTTLADWSVDNKVYYNTFDHWSNKAKDATDIDPTHVGVTFYNSAGKKVSTAPGDVAGNTADAGFRAFGDVLRLGHDLGPGELQAGVWLERNLDGRYQIPKDLTTGEMTWSKYGYQYSYQINDRTDTFQPYVQYDWKVTNTLTVSPGVRYSEVTRIIDAPLNKSTPPAPLYAQSTYSDVLPSITAHEQFSDEWAAYAQAAKGFLAPPIAVIETNGNESLSPETTMNYQLGTNYASKKFTFGADVYYIDFSNFITETQVATDVGNQNTYVNAGGAIYKGLEVEATYALTNTFSLYANASYNKATYKNTSVRVAAAPTLTSALGLLYSGFQGFYGSLMTKFVNSQYGYDNTTDANGDTVFLNGAKIPSYLSTDFAFGYRTEHGPFGTKGFSASVDINNIFNVHKITGWAGNQSVSGDDLYWGLPGRGVFFDISMKF
ncbi:MAG: TonB-dependent receptor [Rudaea sp.]|uniref:TonB-dependent receptor n=1 Tax=Rudaea sp. TaxID=2136325 RepID=UPI0039E5542B